MRNMMKTMEKNKGYNSQEESSSDLMSSSYDHSEEVDKVDDMISIANKNSENDKSYIIDDHNHLPTLSQ